MWCFWTSNLNQRRGRGCDGCLCLDTKLQETFCFASLVLTFLRRLSLPLCSGADAILLITSVLPNQDLAYFMKAASALGMQCLIEVHTEEELERVLELEGLEKHLIGINNRNLETFVVDLGNTKRIMESKAGQQVRFSATVPNFHSTVGCVCNDWCVQSNTHINLCKDIHLPPVSKQT